jgi:leucyl-tRNA synthetase
MKINLKLGEYKDAEFICDDNGKIYCSREVEKMCQIQCSDSDAICNEYGADTLRLYEMFLGPLEQAKPGIQQVFRSFGFLKKLCRLYFDGDTDEVPTKTTKTTQNIKKWQMTLIYSMLRFHNL